MSLKDNRISSANEMNGQDLLVGSDVEYNFEPIQGQINCYLLCVPLKRDANLHLPLSMITLPIEEAENL